MSSEAVIKVRVGEADTMSLSTGNLLNLTCIFSEILKSNFHDVRASSFCEVLLIQCSACNNSIVKIATCT